MTQSQSLENDADDEMEDELDRAVDELVSAEEFLDFFQIPYDPAIVHVNRLHILQRFHNYLGDQPQASIGETSSDQTKESRYHHYRNNLLRAYEDFVHSDALTEKVFKVFHMHGPQETFIPVTGLDINGPADSTGDKEKTDEEQP